jgi:GNAT superfamily N-acetyltransferase
MSLPQSARLRPEPRDGLAIAQVRDESDLRAFTIVQAAGFASSEEAQVDLYAWMWDKNWRALPLADQHFYCLRSGGEPASVLLTVDTGDALGVYAVATPPALRKRGLSSYLLGHVCASAAAHQEICLQVMRGSDAERLYAKLGFVERFIVNVYAASSRPG